MSSEKSGNRDSSKSGKRNSGKPAKRKSKTHDQPPWHHASSKTEVDALKAMLGKRKKHKAKPKKPNSKRDENENKK